MKLFITIVICLAAFAGKGQSLSSSVIGSAGEQFISSKGALEWTLGEIMTETYQQSNGYLTQGFHQPALIIITAIEESGEILTAYPNPARDVLFLKTTQNGEYQIELFDLQGQHVINRKSEDLTGVFIHQLDLQDLRSAIYLLRISHLPTGKKFLQKIEKL